MSGRSHRREFKPDIAQQVYASQMTPAELSRGHALSPSLHHRAALEGRNAW